MGKPVSVQIRYMTQAYKEIDFNADKTLEILMKNHLDDCSTLRTIYNLCKLHDRQINMDNNFQQEKLGGFSLKNKNKLQQISLKMTLNQHQGKQQIIEKANKKIQASRQCQTYQKETIYLHLENKFVFFLMRIRDWRDQRLLSQHKIGPRSGKVYFLAMSVSFREIESRDQILDSNCNEKIKYPLSLHVFGLVGYDGQKKLIQVIRKFNSRNYIQMISDCFNEIGQEQMKDRIFMQDQASCHFSKKTIQWLEDQKINYLKWPPKVVDLNPKECVWSIMKEKITNYSQIEFKNQDEIFAHAKKIFQKSPRIDQIIRNSVLSLPNRVQEIIKNQGQFYYN